MASEFTVKTAETVRDDILRTYRAGLIDRGVTNPNVTPGSDVYVLSQAVGDQIEVAMANAQVKADEMMPDTATGEDLDRSLAIYGLTRREASGAVGNITLSSTASTTIATGEQLIDGAGLRFEVVTGSTYANGDLIPVQGVDTGAATNHYATDVLRWVSTPPYCDDTALVAAGGLTDGVDEENDETARERLYARLRVAPGSGNWQHIAELAEESSTLVQKAFVYPAVNGPSNVGVAVVAYATSTSKSREVPALTVTTTVKPYIDGLLPEHVDTIVTTVADAECDAAFYLTLPASPKASPAGPGGGWTDGTTWPKPAPGDDYCYVTNTPTSSTRFRVSCSASPIAGVTQIAWLSPTDWTVYTGKVTTVHSFSSYVADITIDKPFTGIDVDHFVSPNAVNIETYFNAILDHFAMMGPGQKVDSSSSAYYRGYRHPTPQSSWPNKLDATILRALTDSGDEVLDASFAYPSSVTLARVEPDVPASVADPPNIWVPRYIGIYENTQ